MISSQILRGQGKNNTGQRKGLSKSLYNFKNVIVNHFFIYFETIILICIIISAKFKIKIINAIKKF